ncbi:hypothetical protein GE061_019419 [Apolygus lucorum]|uniref:Uncharacterized protein n=1 Tax=Apolygus lucorum TaxID=248454 RepID=A0A8S9XAC0_APOLU|nr:hypothetical protein GE061_019419 [Apolygus lucorum]
MGLNGLGDIFKLVAFILVACAFGLSVFVFKDGGGSRLLIPGVFGGFFGYYLAAFLGMILGDGIDSEIGKTWAIYACVALFGVGLHTLLSNSNCGNNSSCTLCMIAGILGVAAAVFCFLEGFFSK